METSTKTQILTLLRSGLTGERLALPEGVDMDAAYREMKRHQIVPICYVGAVNCGVDKTLSVMGAMFQDYYCCLVRSEGQMRAIAMLCRAFEERNIDHMPLKGCNLKPLYPKPELRVMGDADILIRMEQYDRIKPVMLELGYEEKIVSDYELVWDSAALHLELHRRMIPSQDKVRYAYYGDGWKRAVRQEGCRYGLSPEDEFVYLLLHLRKHYCDGGVGCRHVTDLWVWQQAHPNMDRQRLENELQALQLKEFYENMQNVVNAWFGDGPWDEKTRFITEVILTSGSWGSYETQMVATAAKHTHAGGSVSGGKVRRIMEHMFPPSYKMQRKFGILKQCPVLLPFFWPVHWLDILLFRRKRIRQLQGEFTAASEEKITSYQQALEYVGLKAE